VWVTVRRLRRKLERDPDQPRHLLTERGIGYRLVTAPAGAPATTS
jgi:two-component system KDP operon response regulator KdpE